MKYEAFEKVVDKFVSKNSDLISRYEERCNDVFDDNINDLYQVYEGLSKVNKFKDVASTLRNALFVSIETGCNILDSLCDKQAYFIDDSELNSTQRYFKEVNDIYVKNHNNYDIEYCEANREKLIEMNLKSVISVAKNYQGLGLSLNELISAGNLGLCIAYDRYDPNRAKLKDDMVDAASELDDDTLSFDQIQSALSKYLTYGDIAQRFAEHFNNTKTYTRKDVIKWINRNVSNAKFNSIANMWIRAYILIEIDNCSRVVRKPKTEIYKEACETGSYKREQVVDIDAPISDDSQNTIGDLLQSDDDAYSELEVSEAYDLFKAGMNKLLDGVKSRDRSVFLKKFGIGLPRPLLPREIAEQEGLSIARVSQIFQNVTEIMQSNAVKYNINISELFEAAHKLH